MKKFYFLFVILTLLSGCKYGSYKQASDACKKWEKKGDKYSIKNVYGNILEFEIRDCLREDITKQILGVEYPITPGFYENAPRENRSDSKVKKRFQY